MGKIERLEQEIRALSAEKLKELRGWFIGDHAEGRTKRLNHHTKPKFWTCYRELPTDVQPLANKCFELANENRSILAYISRTRP